MTTHETINRRYAEIQTLLRDTFGAEGRGVGEMVRSVESSLPTTLAWEIRAIAHIRNKVVHEGLSEIPRYFEPLCIEAVAGMKRLKPKKAAKSNPQPPAQPAKAQMPLFAIPQPPKAPAAAATTAANRFPPPKPLFSLPAKPAVIPPAPVAVTTVAQPSAKAPAAPKKVKAVKPKAAPKKVAKKTSKPIALKRSAKKKSGK
ncbi:hypothetical protein [Anatilimnocola floriformis]|uniref:hypothetical protein n=1 Tax=Anatilimnocola floriformis TaxID=2948575 RepID=UPI0020C4A234|nr:hypothetical protein [Anatilimnocola floriformis]